MSNDRFWNRIRKLYKEVQNKSMTTRPSAPRPRQTQRPTTPGIQRTPVVSPQPVTPQPVQPEQGPMSIHDKVAMIHQAGQGLFLLEILYDNVNRLVEPYSFREKDTGRVFFGHCSIHDRIHSFRIEKIQFMRVSKSRFAPRWDVEL